MSPSPGKSGPLYPMIKTGLESFISTREPHLTSPSSAGVSIHHRLPQLASLAEPWSLHFLCTREVPSGGRASRTSPFDRPKAGTGSGVNDLMKFTNCTFKKCALRTANWLLLYNTSGKANLILAGECYTVSAFPFESASVCIFKYVRDGNPVQCLWERLPMTSRRHCYLRTTGLFSKELFLWIFGWPDGESRNLVRLEDIVFAQGQRSDLLLTLINITLLQ
jgi:hypothetical protein